MKRVCPFAFSWLTLLRGLAVCAAALLVALPARAQPGKLEKALQPPPFEYQTHVFRRLLFDLKFQPVTSIDQLNPAETIIIVLGDSHDELVKLYGPRETDGIKGFLNQGGAILLANDAGPFKPLVVRRDVLELTAFELQPARYHYDVRKNPNAVCYLGDRDCPYLVPVANGQPHLFENPNEQNRPTLKVATNLPGNLERALVQASPPNPVPIKPKDLPDGTRELAHLPNGCFTTDEGKSPSPYSAFMVSRQVNQGRLLVIADHSIFINMMMLPSDNNNVEFAVNCVNWLSEGDKRKKVLFLEDGEIQSQFEVPIKPSLPPTLNVAEQEVLNRVDAMVGQANGRLRSSAEQSDSFNGWIHRRLTEGGTVSPWRAVGGLFVLLTVIALIVGFFRLVFHGVQNQSPVAPSLVRLVEQQEPIDSLMEQRNRGMMEVSNLWEVGRHLARQAFEAAGIAAKAGERLPKVEVQGGGWWARRRLRRNVAFLWALGFAKKPPAVRPSQWPGLLRQLEELRRALASGSVRLG